MFETTQEVPKFSDAWLTAFPGEDVVYQDDSWEECIEETQALYYIPPVGPRPGKTLLERYCRPRGIDPFQSGCLGFLLGAYSVILTLLLK